MKSNKLGICVIGAGRAGQIHAVWLHASIDMSRLGVNPER